MHQWETVKSNAAGNGQVIVRRKAHDHFGIIYSLATAGEERLGYLRLRLEVVEGVVRCANADEIQQAIDDSINAAVLDLAEHVKHHGVPPAWKPRVAESKKKGTKTPRPLTEEQRVARRLKSEQGRNERKIRDRATRDSMKGGGKR